jgi:hypothetical protein
MHVHLQVQMTCWPAFSALHFSLSFRWGARSRTDFPAVLVEHYILHAFCSGSWAGLYGTKSTF